MSRSEFRPYLFATG